MATVIVIKEFHGYKVGDKIEVRQKDANDLKRDKYVRFEGEKYEKVKLIKPEKIETKDAPTKKPKRSGAKIMTKGNSVNQ